MQHNIIPSVDLSASCSDDLHLQILYSPFDLSKRDYANLVYQEGAALSHYLEGLPRDDAFAVFLGGQEMAESVWDEVIPGKGEHIVLIQNVFGGGGDNKGILRSVALIAVAAFSAWATGGISSTFMKGLAAAAINTAGALLINALIPMPTRASASEEQSSTYSLGAPSMNTREGSPIPVLYGEHWTGGLLIGMDKGLSDNDEDEVLTMLVALSEGEISEVKEVLVNDQPIESYQSTSWSYKRGALNEPVSSEYAGSIRRHIEVGRAFNQEMGVVELPAGTNAAELQISFPYGLIHRDDDSNKKWDREVEIRTAYRIKGGTWTYAGDSGKELAFNTDLTDTKNHLVKFSFKLSATDSYNATLIIERKKSSESDWVRVISNPLTGIVTGVRELSVELEQHESTNARYYYRYRIEGKGVTVKSAKAMQALSQSNIIKDCTSNPKRVIVKMNLNSQAHDTVYELGFFRITAESESDYIMDECWLNAVEAVQYSTVAHRGTAVLRATIKATDQLNGTPDVVSLVRGRKVNTYDRRGNQTGYIWSDNPAWISLDIAIEIGSVPKRHIDFDRFVDWAAYCNSNKLKFNGVFDSMTSVWDALQIVTRCGLAKISPVGSQLSLIIYEPRNPVMVFGSSNMLADTLSVSWSSSKDRANVFEAEYYDIENKNAASFVKIVEHDEIAKGAPIRENKVSLPGVTNKEQAEKILGVFRANNKYISVSCTFDAYLDAIACSLGDVVLVQSDHIDWGRSCRTLTGQAKSGVVQVDLSEADIAEFGSQVMVHYPTFKLGTAKVAAIDAANKKVTLDAAVSRDVAAIGFGSLNERLIGSDGKAVYLDRIPAGLAVGSAVDLIKFDHLFTSNIMKTEPEKGLLHLYTELPADILPQSMIHIGKSSRVAKPFVVTAISGDGDFKRTLSCVEYNESIFNLSGEYEYVPPMNPNEPPAPVRNLGIVEEIYKSGMTVMTRAYISWERPLTGSYASVRLGISLNGQSTEVIRIPTGTMSYVVENLQNGDSLTVTANTLDMTGQVCPISEVVTHTVLGTSVAPKAVEGFKAGRSFAGITLSWASNREADVVGYQIRQGSTWGSSTIVVERLDTTSTVIDTKEAGSFTFLIKAIDVEGNMSESAASTRIEIKGPDPVTGLTAIQNDRVVILRWDKHPSPDVTSYTIRRGQSWAMSEHLADVSGNSYSIDSDSIEAEDYFWVKAIDRFGIPSASASFAAVARNDLEDYNVIHTVNFGAAGWDGVKVNMLVDKANSLVGVSGQSYLEYRETEQTHSARASRLIVRDFPFSVAEDDDRNWASLGEISWAEAETMFWIPSGVDDSHRFERYISTKMRGRDASLFEGYDCHTVTSVKKGYNESVPTLSETTLTAGTIVRGAMQAVGMYMTSAGYARFPLKGMAGMESQLVFSIGAVRSGLIGKFLVEGSAGSLLINIEDIGREFHIGVQGGSTLILAKPLDSSNVVNRVINLMVRQRSEEVVVSASVHGGKYAETTAIIRNLGAIQHLKITEAISESGTTPALCLRSLRLEKAIEISGREQLAAFHAKTPRLCGWTRYEKFTAGFYDSDEVDIVYRVWTDSTSMLPGISSSVLIVDVPDVIDRGYVEVTEPDNMQVKFNRKFTVPPRVVPQFTGSTGADVVVGATVYASNITTDGFYVSIYDSMGSLTTGRVNWNASGY
ncbi:phage tail protein [Photobacterium ganghwense]|uniref:phage tail protein n=1 Tax=Photobacterium ganghwense TaxID=320778 RepID=UPI001A900048|nr:phage tail protein [Photobacterium ganghwense]QSV17190.1 hypothetical protein FH974_19825 [Photobacterium ganghwense]